MPIESCEETKTVHEYLVKLHNMQDPIKCRITETKNTELPFYYEAEFLSKLEPMDCKTHEEAFSNLNEYLAELIEPLRINENY